MIYGKSMYRSSDAKNISHYMIVLTIRNEFTLSVNNEDNRNY